MDMKNIDSLDPSVFNIQEVKDKKEEMEANIHLLEDTTKTKAQRAEENKVTALTFISILLILNNLIEIRRR
jgi:hypothetical protein